MIPRHAPDLGDNGQQMADGGRTPPCGHGVAGNLFDEWRGKGAVWEAAEYRLDPFGVVPGFRPHRLCVLCRVDKGK